MNSDYRSGLKVGILGGGQLGRMFIQEALNFDVNIYILDPAPEAPCAQIAHEFVMGDLNDFDTVYSFGQGKDVVTIEIEHVNKNKWVALELMLSTSDNAVALATKMAKTVIRMRGRRPLRPLNRRCNL